MQHESYRILTIEAKDLYGAMNQVTDDDSTLEYNIRDKNGNVSLRKFTSTLDWSLDSMKLEEVYEKRTRRKDFCFRGGVSGHKHTYTKQVICVTFNYAYKEYNMAGKNTYIRNGYNYRDCEFVDGVCVKNGNILAGIQTNIAIKNPVSKEILGKYFDFEDNCYVLSNPNGIKTIMDKSELRQYLYTNGFRCDGIDYVRYKRSAGSSRVGKCLFVNKALAADMEKYDKCGIRLEEGQAWDLAAWEAYIALPMSSIIDTIRIPLDSILVIDDYNSRFKDKVVAVTYANGHLEADEVESNVKNTIWDGQSLLDVSLFENYKDKGMLLLRNQFFKSCCFNTNLQQWFADNGITSVEQLSGFTLAKEISQIKLVTTPSSIKYVKFGSVQQWLENVNDTFGVVKYEKKPHPFNGKMAQAHYQLFNTLEMSYEDMEEMLKDSLNYISAIRRDPDVLRYAIQFPSDYDCDEEWRSLTSKNEIVFKMLGINNDFANTKLYQDFRDDLVKSEIRNLKRGHILVNGNYSTLFGNGTEMLKACIGQFDGTSVLQPGQIYSKRFEFGKTILGSRSPHITVGNVMLSTNTYNELYEKYFNVSTEIVCINSINENILQRLDGADFDSDTVLLIDNDKLVEIAKKNYEKFKVPTSFVESKHHVRYYNNEDKADLDIKTSVNKIGEIVNLSQQLNSLMWEKIHKGKKFEDIRALYYDICKLAVLSGIEIDKAKKEFEVNSGAEINALKQKYKLTDDCGKIVKPMFFKMITIENGFELSPNIKYRYFDTTMDYLQRIIQRFNFREGRSRKKVVLPFMSLVKEPPDSTRQGYYYSQKDKLIQIISEANEKKKALFVGYDLLSPEEKKNVWCDAGDIKQQCINDIDKLSNNLSTMYLTLKELDNDKDRNIARFVFEVLFGKPNQQFFKMIKASKEPIHVLEECEDGDYEYYGFKFKKIEVEPRRYE